GYEGFGYPLVEAMAVGCPVIWWPCTSIPEVVGNAALEISGPTVEGIMNTLLQALNMQPAEKLDLVERGKNQAKQFLPGSAAGNFSSILSLHFS
ncbi:MAG: glycosyltransferase, partial [Verrucomicrobia bacterium]|nr:glycosyltransferase [Verrucomicrobiota bacterium]